MAKRSAVEQIVIEERTVSDAILKLVSSKEKTSAWHLKWAKFEEDEYLIFIFTKLAELRWIWDECLRQFSEKYLEYTKTFKEIYHKERVIEENKKALQACEANMAKIKKQIETAQKKSDSVKLHSLDREFESQQGMMEHLQNKIDTETGNLFGFKVEQIQKGLKLEAHAGLQLADQLRHVFVAQRRIADLVGSTLTDNSPAIWQMVTQTIIGLSETLKMYPPPSGAVDPLPSPSESPYQGKKTSSVDSPIHSPLPGSTAGTGSGTLYNSSGGRRSFPFTFRPLPHEPVDSSAVEYHVHQNHHGLSPTNTPHHHNKAKFTRTASDITPQGTNASSTTLPFRHKTSLTIFEENMPENIHRSRSASQPTKDLFLAMQKNMANAAIKDDLSPSRSRSHSQYEVVSISSQDDGGSNKSSRATSDVENQGGGVDSEPGYADPIDALRKYYETQNLPNGDCSSLDAPYQSINEVQKLRQAQLSKVNSYDDDPTYSRPFDCLIGLPNPVKVSGEMASRRVISPLAIQRHSTPDFPVSLAERHPTKHRRSHHRASRRHQHAPRPSRSSSEDNLSSSSLSPSPEPGYSPIISNRQSVVSFELLGDEEEDAQLLLADEPQEILKSRLSSDGGDLLSVNSFDTQSPLTSPQPLSPLHVPSPVEITKMQNGYAKVVYPDLFISN